MNEVIRSGSQMYGIEVQTCKGQQKGTQNSQAHILLRKRLLPKEILGRL